MIFLKEKLTINEIQLVSLEILYEISTICETQNFQYSLIYGTLIGAIRHHGYIPWDDDIDIMMPRPDYEKFLIYMKNNTDKYPNLHVFNHEECSEYPYMITRVSDDRYVIKMENEKPYGMGIFIDIYPFDGLGDDKKEALAYGMKGDRLSSLCYQASREHFAIETTTSILRIMIKYPVYIFSKIIGKEYFQNKLEKLAGKRDYESSKYIGCVIWLSGGEKDIFPREWFDETIFFEFEKYKFRVPKNYDKVLRHIYGNYMALPPMKDRIGHHCYEVYKK